MDPKACRLVSSHQRHLLRQHARRMRHEPTHTEWTLWLHIRGSRLGCAFRRQVVLQGFIADFYASSKRLILEVDGLSHIGRFAKDAQRDRVLTAAGYRVLRVVAEDVLRNLPLVLERIHAEMHEAERG